jgi:D-sedoheptulose 7-phosphate isomerase
MRSYIHLVEAYFTQLQDTVSRLPSDQIDQLIAALLDSAQRGSTVFIFGNGGSASTASHFACDLAKNTMVSGAPRFRVIALNDNIPLMTAWANDTSYDNIYAAQLSSLVKAGDIVIGISCSGNSANVLNAMAVARQNGATTIALTGDQGGRLKEMVDYCILAPSPSIEQQEDVHLILEHCICAAIREELRQGYANATIPDEFAAVSV